MRPSDCLRALPGGTVVAGTMGARVIMLEGQVKERAVVEEEGLHRGLELRA